MKILIFLAMLVVLGSSISEAGCTFQTAPTAMNFGALSPANSGNATAISTVTVRCTPPPGANPIPYTMTDDDGLNEAGPNQNRMQNTGNAGQYLRYSLTYAASGFIPRNVNTVLTFTGTVSDVDYQNAWVGNYSDTIVITINP